MRIETLFILRGRRNKETANQLKTSDKLLLSDGTRAIIEQIQVEKLEQPETTYNFEVEDFHTHYVSESKILVHNLCAFDEFYNAPESLIGKSADDVEKISGDGWTKKPYGSKKQVGSFISQKEKANSPIIKVIGTGYNPLTEVGVKYVVMPFIIA